MKINFFIHLLVAAMFVISACAGTKSTTEEPAEPTQPSPAKVSSSTGTYFSINEVGLGSNGFIALTNFTDVSASLAGLYLCQGAKCFELPDAVVSAGQTVRVSVGDGNGLEDVIATNASVGELHSSDGEIALFASDNIEDPHEMLVYFQWGSDPHDLTQTAIEAGLWVQGGYGPSSENAIRLFKVAETGLWLFDEPLD